MLFNGTIYKGTNKISGKCYIGQTIYSFQKRMRQHLSAAKRDSEFYFHRSIRKHGATNFTWEVLETNISHINKLNWLEEFYIGYFDTFLVGGYNMTSGGENALHSVETLNEYYRGNKNPMARAVVIEGVYYSYIKEAAKSLDITYKNVCRRIKFKTPKYKNWNYNGEEKTIINLNFRAVIIEGVFYRSVKEALEEFNMSHMKLTGRIKAKTERFKNWNYATEEEIKEYDEKRSVK